MPSPFAALEDRLSAEVDRAFGESFVHLPMRQTTVNSARVADPDRAQRTVSAVIDDRTPGSASFARLGKTSGGVATSGGAPKFTTTSPTLFVDAAQFAGAVPARLDRIRRVDTGAVYDITNIGKDGQGRLKFDLVQVAGAIP